MPDPQPTLPGDSPTPTTSGGVSATGGPGTTLQSGYYWIRAVAAPNFHKYLQTKPQYVPGTAILDIYTTAGQFQVVDGQLVQLVTGGLLYANVEKFSDGAVKLAVSFKSEKNSYGTFNWSGDALQWSTPEVKRQNLSAWLVCGSQSLWVNLGAYGYMTPAGCADQTVCSSFLMVLVFGVGGNCKLEWVGMWIEKGREWVVGVEVKGVF